MAKKKFTSTNPLGGGSLGGRNLVGMRRGRVNRDGSITDIGPANTGATRRFGTNNSVRPSGGNIVCAGWAYGVPPHGPQPPSQSPQ